MSEPTKKQREQLNSTKNPIEFVQFLAIKDRDKLPAYLRVAKQLVRQAGGTRKHLLQITQVISGLEENKTSYSVITVDRFPNGTKMLQAFDGLAQERATVFEGRYALVIKPDSRLPIRLLKIFAPLFRLFLGTLEAGDFDEEVQLSHPERSAPAERIQAFQAFDQHEPLFNTSLVKYFPVPTGVQQSPKAYYAPFTRQQLRAVAPRLLSLGGYPAVRGTIIEIFTADKQQPFHDDWDIFQIIFYPRRKDYIRLITNVPMKVLKGRNEVFERTIQLPCTLLTE